MADDIAQWLEGLGLSLYAQTFAEHDIDFEVLPRLSEGNLKELGLTLGHRGKFQTAIEALAEPSQLIERDSATEAAALGGPILYTPQHLHRSRWTRDPYMS